MLRLTEIKLPLEHAEDALRKSIVARLGIDANELLNYAIFRRGVDARRRSAIVFIYTVDVEVAGEATVLHRLKDERHITRTPAMDYRAVAQAPAKLASRPVVIGTGPCGLFAALILAQMGFRPLMLERGKAVRERTKDTFGLWRKRILNPESNVQFGEGGAGTFSDGKLYSQIKDPKHLRPQGADRVRQGRRTEEILYVSKPHIGTFRLVKMVEQCARRSMRWAANSASRAR